MFIVTKVFKKYHGIRMCSFSRNVEHVATLLECDDVVTIGNNINEIEDFLNILPGSISLIE